MKVSCPMYILTLFLSGFAIAATAVWLRIHFGTSDPWLYIAFPLLAWSLVATPIVWFLRQRTTPISLRPITLLGMVTIACLIDWNAATTLRPIFFPERVFDISHPFLAANVHFSGQLLATLLVLLITSLVLSLSGRLGLRVLRIQSYFTETKPPLQFVISLLVGLTFWCAFILGLSWIGMLVAPAIWFGIALVLWLTRVKLIELLTWMIQPIHWLPPRAGFTIVLCFGVLYLVALNLNETLRPAPTGFDDMTHYMNRVQLMTERQTILPVPMLSPLVFETIATSISIATTEVSQRFALTLGTFGLFLGVFIIFVLTRQYLGTSAALLASLITLTLPLGPALTFLETKPDSLLTPVVAALAWLLIEYWRTRKLKYFLLAIFTLGLALTIKLTAIIFLPGVITVFVLVAGHDFMPLKTFLASVGLAFLAFAAPLVPWYLHAQFSALTEYYSPSQLTLSNALATTLPGQTCSFSGQTEDMLRFDPTPGLSGHEIIVLPWTLTMNQAGLFATEVGPIFLALLPFTLLLWRRTRWRDAWDESSALFSVLTLLSLSAAMIWTMYGERVTWYLYPVFPLLAVLVAALTTQIRMMANRPLVLLCLTLIAVGSLGSTLVRMKFSHAPALLGYAAGSVAATDYLEASFNGYEEAMRILNRDPEARIIVFGSRFWYGITDNDRRALLDTYLEHFACLLATHGPDDLLTQLRNLDIRYILFSKSMLAENASNYRPTYIKKVRAFVDWSATHLRVVWGSPSHIIYSVP